MNQVARIHSRSSQVMPYGDDESGKLDEFTTYESQLDRAIVLQNIYAAANPDMCWVAVRRCGNGDGGGRGPLVL